MSGNVRRTQDYTLIVIRWVLLALLALATLAPESAALYLPTIQRLAIPLIILAGMGLYLLFLTIALFGGWAGSRVFAHFQSVGDLAIMVALLVLAPEIGGALYAGLVAVAVVIGLRRFTFVPTLAYAVVVVSIGVLAEREALADAVSALRALTPAAALLLTRLLAGRPPIEDLLEQRHPFTANQARALLSLGRSSVERAELIKLLAEAHRLLLTQTHALRAAIVLFGDRPDVGDAYSFDKDGDPQIKPVALGAQAEAPHERVLNCDSLRVARTREPLAVVDVLGNRGASNFVGASLRAQGETLGAVLAYDKQGGRAFTEADESYVTLMGGMLAAALYGGRYADAAATRAALLPQGLIEMLALRRPEQDLHADQVVRLAEALGEELGFGPGLLSELRLGGMLHDIGELGIAGDPFNQPHIFSADEYDRIKEHPTISARVLASLDFSQGVVEMAHQHHERWDGAGYPHGLERADICPAARVLAVADALDAMTAERPYRAPRGVREAIQEIVGNSGTQFDPAVVQALLALVGRHGEPWIAAAPKREKARAVEPWRHRVDRRR